MRLDAEYARAAAAFPPDQADWIDGDPVALRRVYAAARALQSGDADPTCPGEPCVGAGLDGLLFRPIRARSDAAILYFHGGSWVVGSPETHRVVCSHLAVAAQLPVLSLRYRLAPEHLWPAQRADGVRAAEALLSGAAGAALSPTRLLLAGDSAGAAIAFWVDGALAEAQRRRLAGVLGFYGAYGLTDSATMRTLSQPGDGLSRADLAAAYGRLGPLEALLATPGFAIALSARVDGAPCYLAAAELDPVLDDSRALQARLHAGGRASTLDVAAGLPHGYLHAVARVAAVRAALARAAAWIGDRIG